MQFIFVLLILLAAMPLAITFIRWQKLQHIRRTGNKATGVVVSKRTMTVKRGRPIENVQVEFRRNDGTICHGHAYAAMGKFRIGQPATVFYLPDQPARIVLSGGLGLGPMFIFSAALLLFVVFAVYKLDEMAKSGGY